MTNFEKIRVLWIHDTEGLPGRYLNEYGEYFEVVTKLSDGRANFISSMKQFKPLLEKFWFISAKEALPVEIMAVDYDLSKPSAKLTNKELPDITNDDIDESSGPVHI